MPFPPQEPRSFTHVNVQTLKMDQIGVYGIFRAGQWIYIGKGDIRQRLLDHLNGGNPSILQQYPTHWVAEVTLGDPTIREKELMAEYHPICNQRLG